MAEIPINDVDLNPDDTIDDNEDQLVEPFEERMAPSMLHYNVVA